MSDSKYGDKLFTFRWVIKNFSFIRPDRENPLCSPCFNVNAYGIAYIQLYPVGDISNPDCLLLDVKLPSKLEHVPVDCELSCYDLKGVSVQFEKEKITDRPGWKYKKLNESDNELVSIRVETEKENDHVDVLIVQLLFFKQNEDQEVLLNEKVGSYDFNGLSKDLSKLIKSPQFSDVTLYAGGETFSVNKVILWARAPKFANEIGLRSEIESHKNIIVTCIDPLALKLFLTYIYTGKLDVDTAYVPVQLYTIAEAYDIVDLKQKIYIFPSETFASTCIKVDEKTFYWDVNVLNLFDKKVYSPIFLAGCVPWSEFQLIFSFSKSRVGSENVEIRIRRIFPEKQKPLFLHCKLSIMGCDSDVPFTCESSHYFQNDEEWILPYFVSKQDLFNVLNLPDDIIHVKCDISVSGEENSEVERTNCPPISANSNLLFIKDVTCLSKDLRQLYNSSKLSDAVLKVGDSTYAVHKAILCARSLVFSRMFTQDMSESKSGLVEIPDIEPDILNTLLFYVYSGIVKELSYEIAMKLYIASDKYEFLDLKDTCTTFLKTKIEIENACELLLLSDSHSDINLKLCVIDFICSNAEHILVSDDWKDIITFRVSLGSEVLHKLSQTLLSRIAKCTECNQVPC